jgi:hypothetical protein
MLSIYGGVDSRSYRLRESQSPANRCDASGRLIATSADVGAGFVYRMERSDRSISGLNPSISLAAVMS